VSEWSLKLALAFFILTSAGYGCSGGGRGGDDDDDAANSLCNGVQDVGEFTTDDTFDVDGDGYFDSGDPGCAANYSAGELDCDDADAGVHPGALEVHCDGADNDCDSSTIESSDTDLDGVTDCDGDCDDGRADTYPGAPEVECDGVDQDCDGLDAGDGCAFDYTGVWSLKTEVAYTCDGLEISFGSFVVSQSGQAIQVDSDNCVSCNAPGALVGEFTSKSQASVSGGFSVATNCDAFFDMLLTFVDEDSLSGNLNINFSGSDCGNRGCQGQPLQFTGEQ
jgi:hypothetical protein